MNFNYLCQQYELGRLQAATPLSPGTAAQVWRLDTALGTVLVRTLAGKEQGEREWSIAQQLLARGFSRFPAIRSTVDGAPYLELDGACCQVQQFVEGTMPHSARPGVAAALARTAKELTKALHPMIHGDLGPWNMVQREDGAIFVIDFGEAREGESCFDYASLLGGVINHTPPELREAVCREYVRELDCHRGILLEQLRLWAEQGVGRWQGRDEAMVARFYNALNWAEEHLYEL